MKINRAVKRSIPTMFKVFAFAVVLFGSMTVYSCQQDQTNVPAPAAVEFGANGLNASQLEAIEEVHAETEPGARAAAIDKANKVYLVLKVTGACSSTVANAGAKLAYIQAGSGAATVADSVVKSKNGYSSFSVKSEKYNTYLKKTIDKTANAYLYMKQGDVKSWTKIATVSANSATFAFLPTYLKSGYSISCGSATTLDLTQ